MPLGTLREAIVFPDKQVSVDDHTILKLLEECGLKHLQDQLYHVSRWSEHLSPGELQRIAFVRIFIHKPSWVFLDETTSALDLMHEEQLYRLLRERLPNCSLVSIGHRPSLDDYHDHQVDLSSYA